jgi:hypothetical protein
MTLIGRVDIWDAWRRLQGLSPVHRRELKILFVLTPLMLVSGAGVFLMLAEAWNERPLGLSFHIFYGAAHVLGIDPHDLFIFGSFLFIGLFVLISLDEYKQTNGVLLLGVTAIGAALLLQRGVFVEYVNWTQSPAVMVGGFLSGIGIGGLKRDSNGIYHDLTRSRPNASVREFDRAMPRVFYLVGIIAGVGLFERVFQYDSPIVYLGDRVVLQPFQFLSIELGETLPFVLATGVFLGTIYRFRSNLYDKEIIVLGATGSGKSSLMAGLDYSIEGYMSGGRRAAKPSEPLRKLSSRLGDGGLNAFPSTPKNQALPLEFSYKHGVLFPRKVTIRTLDYAGDHLQGLSPHESPGEVATDDIEEVFDIARYLLDNATPEGAEDAGSEWYDVDWFGDRDHIGTDPYSMEAFETPVGEARMGKAEIVEELVKDMIWHADSIGMLYPLEDYAFMTFERGTNPPYIEPDYDEERVEPFTRPRDVGAYQDTYHRIDNGEQYLDTDIFYIATFADLAVKDYDYFSDGASRGFGHLDRWDLFASHIKAEFLNAGDDRFGESELTTDSYDLVPVYYPIENTSPIGSDEELEIDLNTADSRLPLHGSQELLDRMGE